MSVEDFEPSFVETPRFYPESETARHEHEAVDVNPARQRPQFRKHFALESSKLD